VSRELRLSIAFASIPPEGEADGCVLLVALDKARSLCGTSKRLNVEKCIEQAEAAKAQKDMNPGQLMKIVQKACLDDSLPL
jgi:hypothetical protein